MSSVLYTVKLILLSDFWFRTDIRGENKKTMDDVSQISGISYLAGISFALSLAYSRLEKSRQRRKIAELARDQLIRLGEDSELSENLQAYEKRKYYKLLRDLAYDGDVAEHKNEFRVSAGLFSQLFIELHFRKNLDRRISNMTTAISLVSIAITNLPVTYFMPKWILESNGFLISLSSILLLSIAVSTTLILSGEHIVPSIQETIENCGNELKGYMQDELETVKKSETSE